MFCEYKVFVKVVKETDNPTTIRFLQSVARSDFIVFYEVYHFGSPPKVLARVVGLLKRSCNSVVELLSLRGERDRLWFLK